MNLLRSNICHFSEYFNFEFYIWNRTLWDTFSVGVWCRPKSHRTAKIETKITNNNKKKFYNWNIKPEKIIEN